MLPDVPSAPPEAELIRLARKAAGMTVASAAEATKEHGAKGVGATYWGDVERGQGGRRGERVSVRASDQALAAMARVVGVKPAQLTRAGREDAARVLEEILRRERPAPVRELPADFPQFTDAMEATSAAYVDNVRDLVQLARRRHPDGPLSGQQVFPLDPRGALFWDGAASVGWRQEEGTIKLTAAMLATADAADAAAREGGTETGLRAAYPAGIPPQRHRMVTMRT